MYDQYNWSEVHFGPEFHTYLERSGLKSPCTQNVMSMFLSDDLFNLLATEANMYQYQQNNHNSSGSTKNEAWIDINIAEMKKFGGLLVVMGLMKKSERDVSWSTHAVLHTTIFGNTIPRTRSRQLWKY